MFVGVGWGADGWLEFYNRGAEALARGEAREAVAPLEKALALAPENAEVLHGLAVADLVAGRTAASLEACHRLRLVMAKSGADYGVAMAMAQALAQHDQVAESIEFVKLAQPHAPAVIDGVSSAVFFDKIYATLLGRMARDREAITRLENLVRTEPNDPAHAYQLGLTLIKTANFSGAFEVFRKAEEKFPQSFEMRLGFALASYFVGKNEQAERAYRELTRMRPEAPEAYFALGNFYADTGRSVDSVAAFTQAVRIDPGNYLYHYMSGAELLRLDKMADARRELQRAVELNPRHADSQFWLGKIYLAEDQPEAALRAFETAVKLEPKHIGAYYQLALLYKRRGDTEKAREALRMRAELTRQLHQGIVAERMQ